MSISRESRASWISLTKMASSLGLAPWSPRVLIVRILNSVSGQVSLSLSTTKRVWARARALPRVPTTTTRIPPHTTKAPAKAGALPFPRP